MTANLPSFAYVVVQGQTVWQWLAALATLGLTTAVVVLVYLLGRRVDDGSRDSGPRRHFGRMIATLVAIHLIYLTSRFLDEGINITGTSLFVLELGLRCLD